MKKVLAIYFACLLTALSVTNVRAYAQCPDSLVNTATATASTCQSNGTITINGTSGTAISYQIISGPAGYSKSAQTSNVFASLLPGTYQVSVFCNSLADTISNIIVASKYVQLQAISTTNNVCTSNTPGGTIVTTASNGLPPYQYSYFTGNVNTADNTLTYGASNSFVAPTFGTYNVRVKDACGIFVTQQITISKTYPSSLCITSAATSYGNLSCAQLADSIYLNFSLSNSTKLSTLPAAGITIQLYQADGSCNQGALIKTQHFSPADTSLIVIPKQNVILKLITPCGDTCSYCYAYSASSTVLSLTASDLQNGCATAGSPSGTLGINVATNSNFVYPIVYTVKNSAGTVVATKTISSGTTAYSFTNNFPYDTYTVTATDACGNNSTQTIKPPATSGAAAAISDSVVTLINSCTSINGRVALSVYINGFMPNLANAAVTIIAPSPTNVGINGVVTNGNRWDWSNVLPGATYYIQVNNNCGTIDTLQINTPAGTGQNQQINTTVTQQCGGTGNIAVAISRLGGNAVSFVLNDSSGKKVGSGVLSGNFTNLPAGTYSVVATVSGGCTYSFSKTGIVILPAGSGPSIIKKLGIICENADGTQQTTGQALIQVIGAKPLTAEYKLSSQGDSLYNSFSIDSTGTGNITGLAPYQSYSIRITDVCGNSTITQVTIGQLNALTTETNLEPCIGKPYTLGVPDMINATYQWKKNGVVISTNREINFPVYAQDDDGTYQCTAIVGDGCVIRVSTFTVTSTKCGQTISVNLSGNVFDDANGLSDSTVNGTGISSASGIPLYANLLDANGNVIASVPVNNDGSYSFANLTPGNDVIQLTTNPGTAGNPAPATQLPAGWINTGENIGTTAGNDGTVNGLLPVTISTADILNADFGIKSMNVLPVVLSSFTATAQNANSLLQWSTSSEINAKSFVIERSINGNNWQQLATINAIGNSNSILEYSFTDNKVSSVLNYYRLQLINDNGSYTYSTIQTVNFNTANTEMQLIPNPAKDDVIISLNKVFTSNVAVNVINAQGQIVIKDIISSNEQQHNLKVANLPAGIYQVVIINNGNTAFVKPLIIQK